MLCALIRLPYMGCPRDGVGARHDRLHHSMFVGRWTRAAVGGGPQQVVDDQEPPFLRVATYPAPRPLSSLPSKPAAPWGTGGGESNCRLPCTHQHCCHGRSRASSSVWSEWTVFLIGNCPGVGSWEIALPQFHAPSSRLPNSGVSSLEGDIWPPHHLPAKFQNDHCRPPPPQDGEQCWRLKGG